MKKVAIFLIFAVLATVGLTAQNKDQIKLQLRDGSCLELDDSQPADCDLIQLQDGSCLDINNIVGTSADKDRLQLRDGSCLDINKVGKIVDKDRLRLQDGSCIVEDGIINQFLNLFNKFKK